MKPDSFKQSALNTSPYSRILEPQSEVKTKKPLKIALLGYRSDPFVGGQGIYIKYLSRALHELGHCVHVYSGPPYPDLDHGIELIKVPSLDLYASPNHIRALRWQHLLSFTDFYEWWTMATGGFAEPYTFGRRIVKKIKHLDYDIVHDNQSLCSGLLQLQKAGHTVISTIHHPIHRDRDLALKDAKSKGMKALIRRWHDFLKMQEKVVKNLNHIVTVSSQSQKDIAHYFSRKEEQTPVIFNGVDTSLFEPKPNISKEPFSLLCTSSSDQPLKGLKYLLLALATLKKTYPQIKLHLIGELKAGGKNEKLIQKLKLSKQIQIHKKISTLALIERYNAADIVVCPSLYEGFGLPAAEALSCGCCVVSSNGGALPEVIGDAGIVVPAERADMLAEKIAHLFEHKTRKKELREKARARALTVFSWTRVAEQLDQFYTSAMSA